MMNPEEHPWFRASQAIELDPTQRNLVNFDPIHLNTPDGKLPHVLMTVATSSGVMSIFMNPQGLQAMVDQGTEILKMWKQYESKIVVATPNDAKNVIRNVERFGGGINGRTP